MLYSLISMIIMLAFLDRAARIGRLNLADSELRFKLFAARDELRRSLIKGRAKYNPWFKFLDTTLTRTIHNVKDVNPMLGTVAMVKFRKDPTLETAFHQLETAMALPENRAIAKSYRHYVEAVGKYLTVRHRTSLWLMVTLMVLLDRQERHSDIHVSKDPRKSGESVAPIFSLSPQTSTLLKYSIGSEVYGHPNSGGIHVSIR